MVGEVMGVGGVFVLTCFFTGRYVRGEISVLDSLKNTHIIIFHLSTLFTPPHSPLLFNGGVLMKCVAATFPRTLPLVFLG